MISMIRLGQADFTPLPTQIVDTIPPSHLIAVPVMYEACVLQRKAATAPNSSGWP